MVLPACLVSLVGQPGLGSDRRQLSGGRDGKLGKVKTATAKVVQLLEQQLEHQNGTSGLPLRPTETRTGILQAALLKEASVPHKISAKAPVTSRGKFALSTGAWYMNDEYVRAHDGNGTRVCPPKHHCGYKLDKKLVSCLAKLFAGRTVTELGAGVGLYQQAVLDTGNVLSWTAYDGMPDIETLTQGRVRWADLSVRQEARIVRSDYAMSLEVAEHIPKKYQDKFVANLDLANRHGLVISWSRWGSKASGHGHVNPRSPAEVREIFRVKGYYEDTKASSALRHCATFVFLKETLMVFTRRREDNEIRS